MRFQGDLETSGVWYCGTPYGGVEYYLSWAKFPSKKNILIDKMIIFSDIHKQRLVSDDFFGNVFLLFQCSIKDIFVSILN